MKPATIDEQLDKDLHYIDISIGEREHTIYAWYHPAYRKLAELENRKNFLIKVGRTDGESIDRVTDSGRYSPTQFNVALELRCDDAVSWERLIHSYLRLCGRHLPDAIGTEWIEAELVEIQELTEALIERIEGSKSLAASHQFVSSEETRAMDCD